MKPRFDELVDLDRVVHEPVRLGILTALSACTEADFTYLQRLLRLSGGNLSKHLTRLHESGLIEITKQFAGKMPQTRVRLTTEGRTALERHWWRLEQLREAGTEARPGSDE